MLVCHLTPAGRKVGHETFAMLIDRLYWLALRAEAVVARLTGWRAEHHRAELKSYFHNDRFEQTPTNQHSLVVFAGTIGELNAISSFVSVYFEHWPKDRLIVLMGSNQYFEAVTRSHPDALVGELSWRSPRLHRIFRQRTQPRCLIIGEGPCLDRRFPVRFEMALLIACRDGGVPAYVVNACAYEPVVVSRPDRLEHRFFGALHTKAIRRWFAPSEVVAAQLADMGVPRNRLSVVGNLKFEGAQVPVQSGRGPARYAQIDEFAGFRLGPIFVGGNVNAIDEQTDVFNAWQELRGKYPSARLVVAPRYLQYDNVISDFTDLVQANGVRFALWSSGLEAAKDCDVLIVDTYGELFQFYGIATICYAGRNHGVLESLGQGKPTMVSANWLTSSGGYEIYRRLVDARALIQVPDLTELGRVAIRLVEEESYRLGYIARAQAVIVDEGGAGKRTLEAIREDIEGQRKL